MMWNHGFEELMVGDRWWWFPGFGEWDKCTHNLLKDNRHFWDWCPGAESNHRHADFQSAFLF
jgi:hypothetical protein